MATQLKDQSRRNGLEQDLAPAAVLDVLGSWMHGQGPLYRRLAQALRAAIARGELPAAARLPAERLLARTLAVSRSTVVAAYALLEEDGVLDRRQGSGTRILASSAEPAAVERPPLSQALSRNTLLRRIADGPDGTIDFLGAYLHGTHGLLAPALAGFEQALVEVSGASGYTPLGSAALRQAIATYLTGQGLPSTPEQVMVTSGAQQAIHLAAWHYLQPGDTALLENPTYPGALDACSAAGGRLAGLPTGRQGINVEVLAELVRRISPRLIYLIPTFQNPTGGLMPEHRRRAVAELIDKSAIPLVDDESLAELSLDDVPPPPPIAAFAPSAPILTVGSLSKLVWGGLRVGWVRAPEPIIAQLARLRAVADLGGSLPSQVIATGVLDQLEAVRRQRRAELGRRFARISQLLQRQLPTWTWERPRGGLCLWVRLPHGSAVEFAQVALRHGVSLVAGPVASADHGFADYLRLPFGLEPAAMDEGVRRLAQAWQAYQPLAHPQRHALTVIV